MAQEFQFSELRLKPISVVLGREALVLTKSRCFLPHLKRTARTMKTRSTKRCWKRTRVASKMKEDDEEDDEEEEETASKKPTQLKSILKKNGSKKRDLAAEDEKDEEEEQDDEEAQSLSRKERRLQKKARVFVPSKSKPAATKRNGNKASKLAGAAAKAASAQQDLTSWREVRLWRFLLEAAVECLSTLHCFLFRVHDVLSLYSIPHSQQFESATTCH